MPEEKTITIKLGKLCSGGKGFGCPAIYMASYRAGLLKCKLDVTLKLKMDSINRPVRPEGKCPIEAMAEKQE